MECEQKAVVNHDEVEYPYKYKVEVERPSKDGSDSLFWIEFRDYVSDGSKGNEETDKNDDRDDAKG